MKTTTLRTSRKMNEAAHARAVEIAEKDLAGWRAELSGAIAELATCEGAEPWVRLAAEQRILEAQNAVDAARTALVMARYRAKIAA